MEGLVITTGEKALRSTEKGWQMVERGSWKRAELGP